MGRCKGEPRQLDDGVWSAPDGPLLSACFDESPIGRAGSGDSAGATRRRTTLLPDSCEFIFSSDQLSVQVHPADDYALGHEGGPGKTEVWYVVDAEPGARLAIGLTEKFPTDELRRAAANREIKNYLNWIEARKGQVFFRSSRNAAHNRARTHHLRDPAKLRSHLPFSRFRPPRGRRQTKGLAHRAGRGRYAPGALSRTARPVSLSATQFSGQRVASRITRRLPTLRR